MLCLNIRSTQARIGINSQLSKLESHMRPAELHRDYVPPRADVWSTMPKVDIDSYPSRHAYGAATMDDFTRANGEQGLADVQEATSAHTQSAWDFIENGAKPHGENEVTVQAESKLAEKINKQRYISVEGIPDPTITVTSAEVQGEIDPGHDRYDIQTYDRAEVNFIPGSVEIYLAQKASVRTWTTEGHFDIYA